MGRPPKQYEPGKPIGEHGLILVQELPYIDKGKYKERRIEVICPSCGEKFITDLRRVVKKDTKAKKAVRKCQSCSRIENNKRISECGKQSTIDLTGQRFGKLVVLNITDKRMARSPV